MATQTSGDACLPITPGMNADQRRPRRRWHAVRRGEPVAATALEGAGEWLAMARDDACRISDVCDFPVRCREGSLWITAPEYPGDSVVAAGEQLRVTSRETIMVVALAPSSMWVPEGFAVDGVAGTSRRRMALKKLRHVTPQSRAKADASAEPPRPTTGVARLALLQKFIATLFAALAPRGKTGTDKAREGYLSQSVDHADFENRLRTWDIH